MNKLSLVFLLSALVMAGVAAKSLRAVTDQDILDLSVQLHAADVNGEIVPLDVATTTPLFPSLDINTKPTTWQLAFALFCSYEMDVNIADTIDATTQKKEDDLLDAILATEVMTLTRQFLANNGLASSDLATFRDNLKQIWFGRYDRWVSGVAATSGYEHVTVGELSTNVKIEGLHSWIYINHEETDGDFKYAEAVNKIVDTKTVKVVDLPINLVNGSRKAKDQLLVGASPELEMALGTLCFLARPDADCLLRAGDVDYTWMTYSSQSLSNPGVKYVGSSHAVGL